MNGPKELPSLPEVKKNIRALLISAPRGLSVDDIEHDYQAVLGKPLPFKHFRCKTALEFLKTMPDVVSPCWSNGLLILKGIADDSSKHIAKLVARQNVNTSKSRRISKAPVSTKPLVVPDNFRRNIKELLSVYPNGVLGSALNQAYSLHYGESINYSRLGFRSMSQLLNALQDIATIVKNTKGGYRVCARKNRPKTPPPVRKKSSLLPPPPLKPSSQNVPPSKVPPSRSLSTTDAPKTGAYIIPSKRRPLTDLNSLEGNASVKKEQVKKNVERVKDLLDSKSGVSESMKDELISLLAKRPNGVWAARLPFEYKTLIGKELNILAMGFYSIIEMAAAMPDIFRTERPFPNGDWLLFLAAKSRKDKNITKVDVPENAIGKGVGYSQQSLPEEFYIELYVTHIRTPDCFWIQLIKYADEVLELQNTMRKFYSSKESAQFMLDESLIKLGQVCVARFPVDREWYRGLITAMPSQFIVEVFYVDYGNSSQVSTSDLRLMKKDFFQLPSQAIKSKLANITPKLTKWDTSAAHRMDELTTNKALIGLVSGKKDGVLDLCICDTNGKDDIHINDKLVSEGFAEFKQVNGRSTPPGLPPPEPVQQEINQQITLNTLQTAPTFPDYSFPLNWFTSSFPYDFSMPLMNMPPVEGTLPQMQEEIAPINVDEEKPSEEDLEFMRQVCEELSDVINVVVKRLNLPGDKIVHVIKFEEKPYVVRSEISALLWESDKLRSRLREVKKVVEKEIISREDHEELFDELRRLKVGDFAEGDEAKEYASLYPLSTVPGILETFDHPLPKLVQMMKNEVAAYEQNPGTYWDEENDSTEKGTNDSTQSEAEEEHDLEELRLAEQALQFARKRILRAMTNGDITPSEDIVDEAADVENRLAHIRELISLAEAKEAARDTEGSKESQGTQGEKVEHNDADGVGNVLREALPTQPEQRPAQPEQRRAQPEQRSAQPEQRPAQPEQRSVQPEQRPAQPEQQPTKPVGVTRPEIRQPSPTLNNNPINFTTQNPDIPISTPQCPNIPTSTSRHSNITMSTSQNFNTPTSISHPNIPRSTPRNPSPPNMISLNPNIPTFIPQYPNIPINPQYPNIPTSTFRNPNLSNTIPQDSTETIGNLLNNETFRSTSLHENKVAPMIGPGGDKVYPGTSMDNQQPHKDLVKSGKKEIERMSWNNEMKPEQASESIEIVSSKKRTRSSSQASHHVMLPHPNQPLGDHPLFMHAGHMTFLPHVHFPFPGPTNVPFQRLLGPIHPLSPPPYSDLMHLNGPLSAPNLVNSSQLLFQYGSPFPNNHPRRGQR